MGAKEDNPIRSPEDARVRIYRWLHWIAADPMEHVGHKSPTKAAEARENCRCVLSVAGVEAHTIGHIYLSLDSRKLAKETGLSQPTVSRHLAREAEEGRFLRLDKPGRWRSSDARGASFCAVYKLNVDAAADSRVTPPPDNRITPPRPPVRFADERVHLAALDAIARGEEEFHELFRWHKEARQGRASITASVTA